MADEVPRIGIVEQPTTRWQQRFRSALGGVDLGGQTRLAVKTPTGRQRTRHGIQRYEVTGSSVRSNFVPNLWTSTDAGVDLHLDILPGRGRRTNMNSRPHSSISDAYCVTSDDRQAEILGIHRGTFSR